MQLVDSHCHIDGNRFDEDRDEVIQRAKDAGVLAMLVVGTGDPATGEIDGAVQLADSNDGVYAAVGVHPHDAKLYDDVAEDKLVALCEGSDKVIAWGEIGLDYHYDHSPRQVQRDVFVRQLRTAKRLGLPVIIHTREADDDTVAILKSECSYEGFKGILHCFGGTAQMAEELIPLGFMVSFAGNVTFKKADAIREAARAVPLERLLIETDSPFLSPEPLRGKRNEPAFVAKTAEFLSGLHGISPEELARVTTDNFFRLFKLDRPQAA